MAEEPFEESGMLGADPGLCQTCLHGKVNQTRRGTAYLRCTRAAWDDRLTRYPRLPVLACVGHEPARPPEARGDQATPDT